ncbi:hypothetical protein [Emticicia sp. BO119]|uniref:hypothetical protein n=1 Tax=Emticicia sp. BO119 TaxID=2757768 RepID=UPI0015F0352B|nr:hypothetical protein [Emticicia sp. BO119]MBA4852029.1 hypothetical protein [Emticicia sp. BO119]
MTDFKDSINNIKFNRAVEILKLERPVTEISLKTGRNKGSISAYLNNKTHVTKNFLQLFCEKFEIEDLDTFLSKTDLLVNGNNKYLYRELSDGGYEIQVPLIPFEAYAKYLDVFNDAHIIKDFKSIVFIIEKIEKGNYLAFKVSGDSMNGGLIDDSPNKSVVLGFEIPVISWLDGGLKESQYGWVILTHKNILFKDIIGIDISLGTIKCHSRNPSPEYSDFELSLNEVYQIFKVIKRFF